MHWKEKDYKDSDEIIWEKIYVPSYKDKKIGKQFDIENANKSKDRDRIVAKAKNGFLKIEIGGETDFNFSSEIGMHRQSKYGIYKKILSSIEKKEQKEQALNLLERCKEKTYKIENFSLMLCNGSLQTLKGTLDKDRIDLFIYLLDNYYKEKDEIILSHCVPEYEESLKGYLNLFRDENDRQESVFNYCKEIYHISDKKLVEDLICSGRKSMNTPNRVVEYMNLAIRFWNCKSSYYDYTTSDENSAENL